MRVVNKILVVSTCPQMHNHGEFTASLRYLSHCPATFTLRVQDAEATHTWEFPRTMPNGASFAEWLAKAPAGEQFDLNTRTCVRIRTSVPSAVSLRIINPSDGVTVMLMMPRASLLAFMMSSEAVVPLDNEVTMLRSTLDQTLAGILGR